MSTAAVSTPEVLYARLASAPRGVITSQAQVHAVTTRALVAVLRSVNSQIRALEDSIDEQLAEIGDARGRFRTPDWSPALAGLTPSTRRPGKMTAVVFRWGADKQLRDAFCDFAAGTRPHTVRVLARACAGVIWRCWQARTPYDPAHCNSSSHKINKKLPVQRSWHSATRAARATTSSRPSAVGRLTLARGDRR